MPLELLKFVEKVTVIVDEVTEMEGVPDAEFPVKVTVPVPA